MAEKKDTRFKSRGSSDQVKVNGVIYTPRESSRKKEQKKKG